MIKFANPKLVRFTKSTIILLSISNGFYMHQPFLFFGWKTSEDSSHRKIYGESQILWNSMKKYVICVELETMQLWSMQDYLCFGCDLLSILDNIRFHSFYLRRHYFHFYSILFTNSVRSHPVLHMLHIFVQLNLSSTLNNRLNWYGWIIMHGSHVWF